MYFFFQENSLKRHQGAEQGVFWGLLKAGQAVEAAAAAAATRAAEKHEMRKNADCHFP